MILNSQNNAFLGIYCHYIILLASQYDSERGLLTPMAPLDPPLHINDVLLPFLRSVKKATTDDGRNNGCVRKLSSCVPGKVESGGRGACHLGQWNCHKYI